VRKGHSRKNGLSASAAAIQAVPQSGKDFPYRMNKNNLGYADYKICGSLPSS
jgi:hypothetical protein